MIHDPGSAQAATVHDRTGVLSEGLALAAQRRKSMYDDPNSEVFATLPGWRMIADPEIEGSSVWVHEDYDGNPDRAILVTEQTLDGDHVSISVIGDPMILPAEIDGECLGTFTTWDAAWDFALASLEIKDGE